MLLSFRNLLLFTAIAFSLSWGLAYFSHSSADPFSYPASIVARYADGTFIPTKQSITKSWSADQITHLEISTIAADIEIERSNDHQIHVLVEGEFFSTDIFQSKLDEDQLHLALQENLDHAPGFFQIRLPITSGKILVKIPEIQLAQLEIKTISGDIELEDLSVEQLSIKSTSGDGEIELIQVRDLTLKTVSGDFDFTLPSSNLLLDAKTTSGDIHLALKDPSVDAEISFTSVSGNFMFFTETYERKHSQVIGAGSGKLIFQTISGDVLVGGD